VIETILKNIYSQEYAKAEEVKDIT